MSAGGFPLPAFLHTKLSDRMECQEDTTIWEVYASPNYVYLPSTHCPHTTYRFQSDGLDITATALIWMRILESSSSNFIFTGRSTFLSFKRWYNQPRRRLRCSKYCVLVKIKQLSKKDSISQNSMCRLSEKASIQKKAVMSQTQTGSRYTQ